MGVVVTMSSQSPRASAGSGSTTTLLRI
jgi:hypothetical protein